MLVGATCVFALSVAAQLLIKQQTLGDGFVVQTTHALTMAWVYILRGAQRYYIGATDNLERRMAEHRRGGNHTTHRFGGQIELVAAQEVP